MIPKMTDDQVREFVDGYVSGQIFTSADIPENQLQSMLPICFIGGLEKIGTRDLKHIGLFWEWRSAAMNRFGVNGMSCFVNCRMMHREDWDRAKKAILAEIERRKNIEV